MLRHHSLYARAILEIVYLTCAAHYYQNINNQSSLHILDQKSIRTRFNAIMSTLYDNDAIIH